MEIWLDTAEITAIKAAYKTGLLFGVTTNPSILANTQRLPEAVIKEILDVQPGPVAVQLTATNSKDMLLQARKLTAFSDRIIIKVPAIPTGYEAMSIMRQENIPIMATAILHMAQVLLSGINQADYVAPYLSRMTQENISYEEELKSILQIIRQQGFATKVIGAAIRNVKQVLICAGLGVSAITLPVTVFESLISPLLVTNLSLKKFHEDWEKNPNASKLFAIVE